MQQKTHRPAQIEITEQSREVSSAWINQAHLRTDQSLVPEPAPRFTAPFNPQLGLVVVGSHQSIGQTLTSDCEGRFAPPA